jgi:tetratricopeptide (TPR) repeat protein
MDYNRAIRINPYNAGTYIGRGVAYKNIGQYDLALEDYDQAIRLDPNFAPGYNSRGGVYLNSGNFELACNDFHSAYELGDCAYFKWARKNGNCR